MRLLTQFQGVVYSFVYSLLFSFVYSFINRLFYRYKKKIFRFILQVCIGISFGLAYYYGLLVINNGVIRVYYFIGLAMGYIIYENYYAFHVLIWMEKSMKGLKKLLSPIFFIFSKIRVILKKTKKKVRQWPKRKKQEQSEQEEEPEYF